MQLNEEFTNFNRGCSTLYAPDMSDACNIVETLGINFKNEICGVLCG